MIVNFVTIIPGSEDAIPHTSNIQAITHEKIFAVVNI